MNEKFLTYEQFGAVGDGICDDMPAIVACHDYANENRLPVIAKAGATYYIGKRDLTATIKTGVNFGTAKFMIDDRDLENIKAPLFRVEADEELYNIDVKTLSKNQKKLDFPHTGNAYVRIFTDCCKIYIRKGLNQNSGNDPSDCFIVDADGNIKNDINWEYPTVSRAYAKSADDTPIIIKGGVFTTIANQAPSKYTYHKRNFEITRSNVTVKGLTHYIIGEGDHGAPYEGFICANECYNFTLENVLLTPHFTYYTESKIPGKMVPMGTYGISLGSAINVLLRGVRQTIDITDARYWGLMGSNGSKEVSLRDCIMSRFDAHCGVTNGSIKNCVLGHHGLNLIGFGKFTVEDTTVYGNSLVNFRPDYGSFFNGELVIKNCTWVSRSLNPNSVFSAHNTGDHDFGYKCMLPKVFRIDGLDIKLQSNCELTKLYILPNYDPEFKQDKPFKYQTPETVYLSGIRINRDVEIELCEICEEYLDTQAECP